MADDWYIATDIEEMPQAAVGDIEVLVAEDMLGLFERTPRFVKRFEDLGGRITDAVRTYADEVRARTFPSADQTYAPRADAGGDAGNGAPD